MYRCVESGVRTSSRKVRRGSHGRFWKKPRNKEEERRFGENLRPDVREEEFCSPADNEGEESAGNSVVGFLKSTFLVDVCIMTY